MRRLEIIARKRNQSKLDMPDDCSGVVRPFVMDVTVVVSVVRAEVIVSMWVALTR
jgi:hypothetical protein